jgi:pyruvate formate lyase activating enzyme
MSAGLVFDIREFTLHDGPGIRTTVFMKGCPLSCSWCHNPEGRSSQPQIIRSPTGDRMAGVEYSAQELAQLLNEQAEILKAAEGGVTFSGGEPLLQSKFVAEVIDLLNDVHVLLDTAGYASERDFLRVVERSDLVFFDLKVLDREAHRRYTGVDNEPILDNLRALSALNTPFVIRVPLIPGVTDTDENLMAIARLARGLPGLIRVDLLPYNKAAGAKYQYAGMEFKPDYDENRELNINTACFREQDIPVRVV